MEKEIKLYSRGNLNNKLLQIKEEPLKYKLQSDYDYRVGFDDNDVEHYTFIDPAGGPFITIGTEIEGHIVKAIHKGGIIEFES